ncbi:hypothetical protein CSB37_01265 [bacterium DOLZORAL124_38_8]|nr:MAG: hypothetical protein CSB37_01265 [bacterium DOLZORAL124_38_8]
MIKKWLVSIFACMSLFLSVQVSAEIFVPENPKGYRENGKETVIFNQYGDATSLASYKGWGVDRYQLNSCVTSLNYDSEELVGFPYFAENPNNSKNNKPNCMSQKYVETLSDEEAKMAIKETDFLRGRICGESDCSDSDTILKFVTISENGLTQVARRLKDCKPSGLVKYVEVKNGKCFAKLPRVNNGDFKKYYNTLPVLKSGDVVRVFVYLHNNAMQGEPDTDIGENNKATNVRVNLKWKNGTVTATIDSDQTTPISDTFQYSLPDGAKLVPQVDTNNQVRLFRNGTKAIATPVTYKEGNTLDIPMGTVYSSYGNMQRLYVDFVVQGSDNPTTDLEFEKYAKTKANGTWHKESEIEQEELYEYRVVVRNKGLKEATEVKVTDELDTNVTFEKAEKGNVTAKGQTVTIDFGTVAAGETKEAVFKVKVNKVLPDGTKIPNKIVDNKGYCDADGDGVVDTDKETKCGTEHVVKDTTPNPTTDLDINKSAKTIANKDWHTNSTVDAEQDGQNDKVYKYKIVVTNTGDAAQSNVAVKDSLSNKIKFVEIDLTKTSNGVVETSTSVAPNLEFDFGTMEPNSTKQVVFDVKVTTTEKSDTILNSAELFADGTKVKVSNETKHTVSTGGNGGGGGVTTGPMVGMCSYGNGAYSCRKVYPDTDNTLDSTIVDYNNCMRSGKEEKVCLDEWIAAKGITTCSRDVDCKPKVNISKCINTKGEIGVKKNITKIEGDTVNSTITPIAAVGDEITYQVITEVFPQSFYVASSGVPIQKVNISNIRSIELSLNDVIVSSHAGFAWTDRNKGLGLENIQLKLKGDKNYTKAKGTERFVKKTTGGDHMQLKYEFHKDEIVEFRDATEDNPLQIKLVYSLRTSQVDDKNTCEITNVAFAVATVTYAGPDGRNVEAVACGELKDGEQDFIKSVGDTARAKIKILRPYVETKNGNLCAKGKFGTKTKGVKCEKVNEGVKTATITKKIDKIGKAAKSTIGPKRLGMFTAAGNNGIYFKKFEKGDKEKLVLPVDGVKTLGRSETFIIEGMDLVINKNLVVEGNKYIPAFIVKGGNIVIDKGVTELHGVFIALADGDKGGEIVAKNNEISKKQLKVSGNLIGDAKKLFISRRYIGNPNEPKGSIQPAVKIMYDLRVFEQTPPGLNNFLGHNWKQEIE